MLPWLMILPSQRSDCAIDSAGIQATTVAMSHLVISREH
jgi:hypothetical protein